MQICFGEIMKPISNIFFALFVVAPVVVTLSQSSDDASTLDIKDWPYYTVTSEEHPDNYSVDITSEEQGDKSSVNIASEEEADNYSVDITSEEQPDSGSENVIQIQPRALSYYRAPQALMDKYIVTLNKLNWHAAYAFCAQNNWFLLRIETPMEQFEVQNYLNFYHLQDHDFWTSGNNFANPRRFLWEYDGPEFKYTNWAFGQPDNYKGGENCVKLYKNSLQWGDDFCENSYHFICQRYVGNNSGGSTESYSHCTTKH